MSGSKRCPECGSCEIVEDLQFSLEQLFCADCGCVLTVGTPTSTQTGESILQAVTFIDSSGQNDSISQTKLRGIVRVRNRCKVLKLPDSFSDIAVSYYERAFHLPMCVSARKEKMEAVMGCCVYLTCQQHRWPLTFATISSVLYSEYELATVFLELVQALKVDVPLISLQDLAKSHCQSFRLFQNCPNAPEEYIENLDKVLERTLQLLELASETWPISGRQPIPIINAAIYLSWQSHKPAQRLSYTISQFCKLCETELHVVAVRRLKELRESCLKVAALLPWLKILKLNKRNVVHHLADILKHKDYLLRKTLEAIEMSTAESEECSSPDQHLTGAAFLPPCLAKPKKRTYTTAVPSQLPNCAGDEDISDSEIELYLRNPDEMACFKKLQAQRDNHQ